MELMLQDIFEILGSNFILHGTKSSSLYLKRDNKFWNNYRLNGANSLPSASSLLNILIIEGFLIFNDRNLLELFNVKFHLDIPSEICHERRKKRFVEKPDKPLYFEKAVWPCYEENLKNYKNQNDVIFFNGQKSPQECFEFVKKEILENIQ